MGLQEILVKIDTDARFQAETILGEGRRAAERQRESWASRGRDEAAALLQRTRDELERQKRQAWAELKLEASKAVLGRKRDLLRRVVAEAWKRLMETEPKLHQEVLSAIVARDLPGADTAVFSGDPLGRKAAAQAGTGPQPRVETAPPDQSPRGGVIIQKGPVSYDFSFDRLLDDLATRHQVEIQQLLFGKSRA